MTPCAFIVSSLWAYLYQWCSLIANEGSVCFRAVYVSFLCHVFFLWLNNRVRLQYQTLIIVIDDLKHFTHAHQCSPPSVLSETSSPCPSFFRILSESLILHFSPSGSLIPQNPHLSALWQHPTNWILASHIMLPDILLSFSAVQDRAPQNFQEMLSAYLRVYLWCCREMRGCCTPTKSTSSYTPEASSTEPGHSFYSDSETWDSESVKSPRRGSSTEETEGTLMYALLVHSGIHLWQTWMNVHQQTERSNNPAEDIPWTELTHTPITSVCWAKGYGN